MDYWLSPLKKVRGKPPQNSNFSKDIHVPGGSRKYRNLILLVLLLAKQYDDPSLQVCDIIKRVGRIYPEARKATILNNLKGLYDLSIIDRHERDIIPKRRAKGKVFYSSESLKKFPKAAEILFSENRHEEHNNNFTSGKYIVLVRLNTSLSPGFIEAKQLDVSRYFGFHTWYGGIVKGDGLAKSLDRVRNSFSKLCSSRFWYKLKKENEAALGSPSQNQQLTRYLDPDEKGRGTRNPKNKPIPT